MSSSTASGWSLESTSFAFAVNKINLLQRYFVASKFLAIETRQTGRKRGITAASAFPCVRKPLHDTTLRAFTQPTVACCLRPIDQQARAALFDQAPSLYASRTERSFGIRRPPTRACFFACVADWPKVTWLPSTLSRSPATSRRGGIVPAPSRNRVRRANYCEDLQPCLIAQLFSVHT